MRTETTVQVGQLWRERDPRVTVPEARVRRLDDDYAILSHDRTPEKERRIRLDQLVRRWTLVGPQ